MTPRKIVALVAFAALAGWFANTAFTEDGMPSEEEMWAKMMELGQPGDPHKLISKMAGEWTAESTFYSQAGEMTSQATSTARMINGGRFLTSDYKGDIMGMPFEGSSILGHNNVTKTYQMIWVDSMSSSIMTYTGTCDADKTTLTFTGSNATPWGEFEEKVLIMFKSDDEFVFEGHGKAKGQPGDFMKQMQIVYKRKK